MSCVLSSSFFILFVSLVCHELNIFVYLVFFIMIFFPTTGLKPWNKLSMEVNVWEDGPKSTDSFNLCQIFYYKKSFHIFNKLLLTLILFYSKCIKCFLYARLFHVLQYSHDYNHSRNNTSFFSENLHQMKKKDSE